MYIQEIYKTTNEEEKEKEDVLPSPSSALPSSLIMSDIFSKEKEVLNDISTNINDCQKLIQVKKKKIIIFFFFFFFFNFIYE